MLEALILTLREGIEAALVVGIIVTFLRREGRGGQLAAVWSGLAAAVAASAAGAWILYRVAVNEEAFEGVLYLISAVAVATFVVWMWRHARAISGEIRSSLTRIVEREATWAVTGGLFLFTFLMVFREGIETMLFLSALSLTTSGLAAAFGALVGLTAAVVFGVLFVRGSVRVDLARFFKITGITLLIFVVQLLFNAYHELSEAGWVPANETTMAWIGPLVRYEVFFIAAVVVLPLLLVLIPGRSKEPAEAGSEGAEARLARARDRRLRQARIAAGALGVGILALLGVGFAHSQPVSQISDPSFVTVDGSDQVRVPLAELEDGALHRYALDVDGTTVRFIAMELDDGEVVAGLDACLICGSQGYAEDASGVVCLHCHSVIHAPTIGQPGGCNPIPLDFEIRGEVMVIAASTLRNGAAAFRGGSGHAPAS